MQPLDLVRHYLPQGRTMQVATVDGDQPWICTVYFVADDELNLYWLSWPTRRHSQEIAKNSKVAIAVPIKTDQPVIGVQAEGTAAEVTSKELVAKIMQRYTAKYNSGHQFYDNFVAGRSQHVLFKFTPSTFVLFDEVNFPTDGRQVVELR